MFLNETKFKQAVKRSYDGMGLQIEHFENGILQVSGQGWILEIDEQDLTKKCRAALVEFAGEIPPAGYGYTYCKGSQKEEIDPIGEEILLRGFTKGEEVEDTRIMIQRHESCYDVFQKINGREPILVRRDLHVIVDPLRVNRDDGELTPGMPVINGKLVIWNNDTMQFAIVEVPYHNTGEQQFLQLINGKNMTWPFED